MVLNRSLVIAATVPSDRLLCLVCRLPKGPEQSGVLASLSEGSPSLLVLCYQTLRFAATPNTLVSTQNPSTPPQPSVTLYRGDGTNRVQKLPSRRKGKTETVAVLPRRSEVVSEASLCRLWTS